jgi:hypothetical protein
MIQALHGACIEQAGVTGQGLDCVGQIQLAQTAWGTTDRAVKRKARRQSLRVCARQAARQSCKDALPPGPPGHYSCIHTLLQWAGMLEKPRRHAATHAHAYAGDHNGLRRCTTGKGDRPLALPCESGRGGGTDDNGQRSTKTRLTANTQQVEKA